MTRVDARRLERLRTRLAQQLALKEVVVTLPRAAQHYTILTPADHDRLLDEAESDPEQQLPYWAEIWPSGLALADLVLTTPQELTGQQVLELGCGLGITAAAVLAAGGDLLATDYSPLSLSLCRYNCGRNAGREPRTLELNWRAPADDLFAAADAVRGYPYVLAADVLYETRDVDPLLALVPRLLAPGGVFWLAEPGRATAQRFLDAAAARNWTCATTRHNGPWVDGSTVEVRVHRLQCPHERQ